MVKEHYGAIDGLRTIACIGIILMHVASNNEYSISGFLYDSMIPWVEENLRIPRFSALFCLPNAPSGDIILV